MDTDSTVKAESCNTKAFRYPPAIGFYTPLEKDLMQRLADRDAAIKAEIQRLLAGAYLEAAARKEWEDRAKKAEARAAKLQDEVVTQAFDWQERAKDAEKEVSRLEKENIRLCGLIDDKYDTKFQELKSEVRSKENRIVDLERHLAEAHKEAFCPGRMKGLENDNQYLRQRLQDQEAATQAMRCALMAIARRSEAGGVA